MWPCHGSEQVGVRRDQEAREGTPGLAVAIPLPGPVGHVRITAKSTAFGIGSGDT